MNEEFLHYPAAPIALKMAVSLGIGMLIGMEVVEQRNGHTLIFHGRFAGYAFLGDWYKLRNSFNGGCTPPGAP